MYLTYSPLKTIAGLALALAALALPSAGIAGAPAASRPDPTAQLARNYQHEDAIYYGRQVARRPGRSAAQLMALHFRHEDALYATRGSASSRLPSAAAVSTDGFDWNDALVGAGSTVAVLLLTGGAVVAIRRARSSGHGQLVRS